MHQPIILSLGPYHCHLHHYEFHVMICNCKFFKKYFLFSPEWPKSSNTIDMFCKVLFNKTPTSYYLLIILNQTVV